MVVGVLSADAKYSYEGRCAERERAYAKRVQNTHIYNIYIYIHIYIYMCKYIHTRGSQAISKGTLKVKEEMKEDGGRKVKEGRWEGRWRKGRKEGRWRKEGRCRKEGRWRKEGRGRKEDGGRKERRWEGRTEDGKEGRKMGRNGRKEDRGN